MFGQKRTFNEHMLGVGPFVLAIISGFLLMLGASRLFLLIGLVGVGFVLKAKWSSISQRKFITFGFKGMNTLEKRSYFIGYGLLIFSVLGAPILLLV